MVVVSLGLPLKMPEAYHARMGWQLRSHTADVRLLLEALDSATLAATAAEAVRAVLVGDSPVAAREVRHVAAAAGLDEGERFFRFVRELFFLADAEGFLPAHAAPEAEGWCVHGERFDAARHAPHYQVKAVTRHRWRYDRDSTGLHVEMVLDL
jgi:SHS2 domain-containing protein